MKTMTPSNVTPITSGQIGKIQEILGAGLRQSGLPSEAVQQVIEIQGEALTAEIVEAVRKRVEVVSNIIVRRVRVNRNRTPQEALKATSRVQYVDADVVKIMPVGAGAETEVYFFPVKRFVSDEKLEEEYGFRGFKPVDPYSLAAVNEADPAFADDHPNTTHWKDADGKWCYAAFDRWGDGRDVFVSRNSDDWGGDWWFAGLRK